MASPALPQKGLVPTVWAHCESADAWRAMDEVRTRLASLGDDVRFDLTASPQTADIPDSVPRIDIRDGGQVMQTLSSIRPDLAVLVKTPVTVSAISACTRMRIPVALVNLPDDSIKKRPWIWKRTILPGALKHVDRIFVTDETSAALWRKVGAKGWKITIAPPLLEGVVAPTCDERERTALSQSLSSRPVWFLNSVPLDEFDWVLNAVQAVQRSWPRLVTILDATAVKNVPAFKDTIVRAGLIVHDRAIEGEPNALTQVFMTDGPDEAGLWYRLAALTYMGGSLSGLPTANPLHAASLGSAILHGARIQSHRAAFDRLTDAGATTPIAHGRQLGEAASVQLAPDACAEKANKAWAAIYEGAEMTDKLTQYIADTIGLTEGD